MSGLPIDKPQLRRTAGRTLAHYIQFVLRTSRVTMDPPDASAQLAAEAPAIIAMWHGQFMLIPALKPAGLATRVMVAQHGDAEILAETLRRFEAELIRGAGAGTRQRNRGGADALRAALRALESGYSVPMTADVPPGPARRSGLGIVTLARLSGRPIIPVAAASSRYVALNTWSRMTVNLPFSRIAAVVGRPIRVPREADEATLESLRLAVEQGLDAATQRAYELAGADPARATPPESLPQEEAPPPGFRIKAYRAAMRLAAPAAPLVLRMRGRKGKEDPDPRRGAERLGYPSVDRPPGRLVWLHAASVGETNAILPVIDGLCQALPKAHFLLTTGTVTSAGLAARRLGARAIHQYVPLDCPEFAERFVAHWRPDLAVLTESEIWPNLILEVAGHGVPLALVNGRMSNRSFGRWRRRQGLARPLFSRFAVILAQNEKLARRYRELGARNVRAVGNLKIDAPPPPIDAQALAALRKALDGRPVIVAASTHEGEDEIVAAAHRTLAREVARLCTIIAPRHPARAAAIEAELQEQGFRVARRSRGELPGADTDIYLADTIGELGTLYALTAVSFVGGSLVEHGGQNPIEAIRHGSAVITGPYWHNFTDAMRPLVRHGGVIEVGSAGELATAALRLLQDGEALARARRGAATVLAAMSGALPRTIEALLALLPDGEDLRRAS